MPRPEPAAPPPLNSTVNVWAEADREETCIRLLRNFRIKRAAWGRERTALHYTLQRAPAVWEIAESLLLEVERSRGPDERAVDLLLARAIMRRGCGDNAASAQADVFREEVRGWSALPQFNAVETTCDRPGCATRCVTLRTEHALFMPVLPCTDEGWCEAVQRPTWSNFEVPTARALSWWHRLWARLRG